MCDRWAVVQLVQAGVVTFVAQTFMALRVYAMSGRDKRLIYGLSVFNIIQAFFGIALMALPGNKGESSFILADFNSNIVLVQGSPFQISI